MIVADYPLASGRDLFTKVLLSRTPWRKWGSARNVVRAKERAKATSSSCSCQGCCAWPSPLMPRVEDIRMPKEVWPGHAVGQPGPGEPALGPSFSPCLWLTDERGVLNLLGWEGHTILPLSESPGEIGGLGHYVCMHGARHWPDLAQGLPHGLGQDLVAHSSLWDPPQQQAANCRLG